MAIQAKYPTSAYKKLLLATTAGILVGIIAAIFGSIKIVPLAVWDTVAATFSVWTWWSIWPLSAQETKRATNREDPGRGISDLILNIASFASLIAVGLVLIQGSSAEGVAKGLYAGLGLVSVVLSWLVIHTIYTLKYADLYYDNPGGGVDFNQTSDPKYSDFAYLSFTVGMTFQVSDTNLKNNDFRRAALHQANLSYFFGTIIIASMINLVVNLSK
jgi:uncharacterized membrane protein